MKNNKIVGSLFACALLTAILVGCAAPAPAPAEKPATSEGDPLCGLGNGQEATGDPIVVGGIVGKTGPDDWSSGARAADAYFNCVNANGGINGRPIQYIIEDDAWNPEKAALAASKLVIDDKVVAMVGNTSFVECGANTKLYGDNGVTVIAAVGVPRECFESPNIAATNAGPRVSTLGAAQYAYKTYGSKRIVCTATNVPNVGTWTCDGIAEWGKTVGVEVKSVLIDPAQLDATSIVLDALSWNADTLLTSLPRGIAIPLYKAGEEQDTREKMHWLGPTSIYDLSFPEAVGPYWDGYVEAQIELNATDSSGPDNTKWRAILDQFGSKDDPRDTFSQAGYLAAKIFVDTALKLDAKDVTRENMSKALHSVKSYNSDLMCGKWYFAPGNLQNANHAGRMAKVQDGKWVTVADCFETEDVDLKPILEMEQKEGLVK